MQRLEVSGAVRLIYKSLGVKELIWCCGSTLSDARPTQHDMLPQHQINIGKSISECF